MTAHSRRKSSQNAVDGVLSRAYPASASAKIYDFLMTRLDGDFTQAELVSALQIPEHQGSIYIESLLKLYRILPTRVYRGEQYYKLNLRNRSIRRIIMEYNRLRRGDELG